MNKRLVFFSAFGIALLACLGWRVRESASKPSHEPSSSRRWQTTPPTTIDNDREKIFQRAFWAHPTSADKIVQAERREWKDAAGVQKWQWFLVVEPSAALLKRLRDDNAFGLIPAQAAKTLTDQPRWFVFKNDEVSVLKSPLTSLQLIFDAKHQTLYAADEGVGFRAGTPELAKPMAVGDHPSIPGRLPPTHPPLPPQ